MNSTGILVAANYIGLDMNGAVAVANDTDGIRIDQGASAVTVGGTAAGAGNVISGNSGDGIEIDDSDNNLIQGNYIGSDQTGLIAVANSAGVNIHDGATGNLVGADGSDPTADAGARNVIAGNSFEGVRITDFGTSLNAVAGNYIGVDMTGETALGNGGSGISFGYSPSNNRVGTTGTDADDAGERNVISGNLNSGVYVGDSGTTGILIAGNYIGLDAGGTFAIGNAYSGIYSRGGAAGNTIGWDGVGNAADMRNVISGNGYIGAASDGKDGIRLSDSGTDQDVIAGNRIGTDSHRRECASPTSAKGSSSRSGRRTRPSAARLPMPAT